MADKTTDMATGVEDGTAATAASIFGECVLKLTHSTTYEPPLYLFPELLPRVPQGTPPLPVWDAVADAVDINASSWRVADASQLLVAGAATAAASGGDGQSHTPSARAPQAMVTLTSMVAQNRFLAAGLEASALKNGSFSSANIIQQLATLQTRMGLTDEEGAAIMSNHFINLLAWQKLCEINGDERGDVRPSSPDHGVDTMSSPLHTDGLSASSSTLHRSSTLSRKRAHAAENDNDGSIAWLPSPDPWATDADLACSSANGEKFISASEKNVEERVDLLRTLAELYQRPWRSLTSQGQQTDYVVPPGTVNVTSPFADNNKVPGAMLDPVTDLGWGLPADAAAAKAMVITMPERAPIYFGSVRVAHDPCFYSVVLSSRNENVHTAPQRVPLMQAVTCFGRAAGLQPSAAVAAAALVPIHAGLEVYTSRPEVLSKFHFALVLRPVYGHKTVMAANSAGEPQREDAEDSSEDDARPRPRDVTVVHTKTPEHYTLWLMNYGRNGVRIAGKGWVLGEPRQLQADDVLVLGEEVELRIEYHATAAAACAATVEANGSTVNVIRGESPSASQVKRELVEDE